MSAKCKGKNKTQYDLQNYPSAELVMNTCFEDYKRLLDTYDKIYEKVNIALVLCGLLLIAIIPTFDYTVFIKIFNIQNSMDLFFLVLYFVLSLSSVFFIVWTTIELLLLMKGKKIYTIDTLSLRNSKMYEKSPENVSVWLIDKYNISIISLKNAIKAKQSKYDSAIIKTISATITYTVSIIMSKGVM